MSIRLYYTVELAALVRQWSRSAMTNSFTHVSIKDSRLLPDVLLRAGGRRMEGSVSEKTRINELVMA